MIDPQYFIRLFRDVIKMVREFRELLIPSGSRPSPSPLDPDSCTEQLTQGRSHYYSDPEVAITLFRDAHDTTAHCGPAAKLLGHIYMRKGQYDTALEWYERYKEDARASIDIDEQQRALHLGQAHRCMGIAKRALGKLDESELDLDEALHQSECSGDPLGRVATQAELGVLARIRGCRNIARMHYRLALSILETLPAGDREVKVRRAKVLSRLATVERESGNVMEATSLYRRALGLAEGVGMKRQVAEDRLHLGICERDLVMQKRHAGRGCHHAGGETAFAGAETCIRRALDLAVEISARETEAKAYLALAVLYRHEMKYLDAKRSLEACLRVNREARSREGLAAVFLEFSFLDCVMSEFDAAEQRAIRAIVECESAGIEGGKAFALGHLGNVYAITGQCERAVNTWREGAEVFASIDADAECKSLNALADAIQC